MGHIHLSVIRKAYRDTYTIGKMYINGEYFCDTLEDKVRVMNSINDKIKGETAIPAGTYKITLQASFNPERWEGEAAAITLKVAAPTWLSLGAFIGYAAVIVMIVVVVMSQFKKKETRKLTNQENSTKENHQE